eukprot:gene17303-23612_t
MSKADILMLSQSHFFSKRVHIMRLVSLVEPSSSATKESNKISLRLVDWFVTNYANTHNVVICSPIASLPFNVYRQYRMQLKAYSKQQFDPFRRPERILFHYVTENIETTVGQLNFFRWLIENRILEYVEEHVDEIEADMMMSTQHRTAPDAAPKSSRPPHSSQAAALFHSPSKPDCEMLTDTSPTDGPPTCGRVTFWKHQCAMLRRCRCIEAYDRKLQKNDNDKNDPKNDKNDPKKIANIAVGIMNDPPGCGKTFVKLALMAAETNSTNLVVVPPNLHHQWVNAAERYLPPSFPRTTIVEYSQTIILYTNPKEVFQKNRLIITTTTFVDAISAALTKYTPPSLWTR